MMAALAKAISRATRTNVDVETLKVLVIFSGAGLLLSLVAAMIYGQAGNAALFWDPARRVVEAQESLPQASAPTNSGLYAFGVARYPDARNPSPRRAVRRLLNEPFTELRGSRNRGLTMDIYGVASL
jgi:hypothetical protein